MSGLEGRRSPILDGIWRLAYRFGFPLARLWWGLLRRQHQGALVAIHVGEALLVVQSSYRRAWNFPGGSVRRGETPQAAARRELSEEIGVTADALTPAGEASGIWDMRPDRVHFFVLRLERLPELRLDNREIIAAKLMLPGELRGVAVTAPVAAYVGRVFSHRGVASAREGGFGPSQCGME